MTTYGGGRLANQLLAVEGERTDCEPRLMRAGHENSFLADIETAARSCSGAVTVRTPSALTVSASGPEGFTMAATVDDGRFVLYFDDWFEEFESEEMARQMFEAALNGKARLKVDALAGKRWRWTLELQCDDGTWRAESTTGHVLWRFWGQQSSFYLRNEFQRDLSSEPWRAN